VSDNARLALGGKILTEVSRNDQSSPNFQLVIPSFHAHLPTFKFLTSCSVPLGKKGSETNINSKQFFDTFGDSYISGKHFSVHPIVKFRGHPGI